MARAFSDYISFVIEKDSMFSEVEYRGNDRYYPIRPFNLYPEYEYRKNDTSHLAMIRYGISSDTMVAVLIEHKGQMHFKILERRYRFGNSHQFMLFFEMSNAYNNMGPHNKDGNNYTVSAMDYIYDVYSRQNVCFVISKPLSFGKIDLNKS